MTDKELSAFGEKLYEGILVTPLPAGMVFAIATAIRQGVPWARLPPPLKLAIFKIAAHCALFEEEGAESARETASRLPQPEPMTRAAEWESSPGAEPQTVIEEEPSGPVAVGTGAGQEAVSDPSDRKGEVVRSE